MEQQAHAHQTFKDITGKRLLTSTTPQAAKGTGNSIKYTFKRHPYLSNDASNFLQEKKKQAQRNQYYKT